MVSYDFARQGNSVILGRGGQVLFGDLPGVIRVRVVAPLQDRIEALREKLGFDERRARQAVQHEDNERAGFHRFFFHANWDSAELYDLIISTRFISEKTAVDLIKGAVAAKEVSGANKERARKLEDLYLAQRARIAIQFEQQLPIHMLEIEVVDGVVTVKGTAGSRDIVARCETVAADIPGMTGVINQVSYVPEYVGA
jgi:hypothetical protein